MDVLNNTAKVVIKLFSYIVSDLRVSPFSVRFIISLTVTLSEKSGLTDFQNYFYRL